MDEPKRLWFEVMVTLDAQILVAPVQIYTDNAEQAKEQIVLDRADQIKEAVDADLRDCIEVHVRPFA